MTILMEHFNPRDYFD